MVCILSYIQWLSFVGLHMLGSMITALYTRALGELGMCTGIHSGVFRCTRAALAYKGNGDDEDAAKLREISGDTRCCWLIGELNVDKLLGLWKGVRDEEGYIWLLRVVSLVKLSLHDSK